MESLSISLKISFRCIVWDPIHPFIVSQKLNNQVKQIIGVLSTAVFGGFLLAFFLIWYYGPTGQYKANQTVLAPEIIEGISFKDIHPQIGQNVKFVFDQTEFVYFDFVRGAWNQKPITSLSYSDFYHYIQGDASLLDLDQNVLQLFQKPTPTALVTTVRSEVSPVAKAFQVIQFTKEDYYRVKLHGHLEEGEWAYFRHQGIYQKIMKLFIREEKP